MPKRIKSVAPPKGMSRLFFRFPILLFRIGSGWIFGKRFLLLNHTGRKSGKLRQVVVEVPLYDAETNTYYVNAGFGPKSDWYQNILKKPENTIQVGNRVIKVMAEPVSAETGGTIMLKFARANSGEAKFIAKAVGYDVDGSDEDWQALGRELIFVAFRVL